MLLCCLHAGSLLVFIWDWYFSASPRFPSGGVPDRRSTQRETQPLALLPRPAAAEAVQADKEVLVVRLRRPRPSHGCQHWSLTWGPSRALQGLYCAGAGHQSPCKGLATQQDVTLHIRNGEIIHYVLVFRQCAFTDQTGKWTITVKIHRV